MINPNFILIFVCLGLGLALRWVRRFDMHSARILNAFVIHVSLPALILLVLPKLLRQTELSWQILVPISMAWILFPLSVAFFHLLAKPLKLKPTVRSALAMTAGLGNTSFVGFPILEAILGKEAVQIGILVDQPGSFLVLSTLGIIYCTFFAPNLQKKLSAKSVFTNVFSFPPFLALLIAVVFFKANFFALEWTVSTLDKLASTLVPIALVAVGMQLDLRFSVLKKVFLPVVLGLVFKLLLAPIVFVLIYVVLLQQQGFMVQVTLLESAMAPMITATVVAIQFGFDEEVASLMLGIGILISLFSVPMLNNLLLALSIV